MTTSTASATETILQATSAAVRGVDEIRQEYNVPALAVGHVKDGNVNTTATDVRKQGDPTPVQEDDVFHLGGGTMALTAVLTALLLEQSLWNWNTTLADAFGASNLHPSHHKTTVGMLLTHRTGLMSGQSSDDYGEWWDSFLNGNATATELRRQFVLEILAEAPAGEPGKWSDLSLVDYMVLGVLLEEATGDSWEDLMQRLFDELAMPGCGFGVQPQSSRSAVENPWPHEAPRTENADPAPVVFDALDSDNPAALWPANGVHCTMSSYAAFLQFHLDGYWGRTTPLLSSESFTQLRSYPTNPDYTYAALYYHVSPSNGTGIFMSGTHAHNSARAWLLLEQDEAFMAFTNVGRAAGRNATWAALFGAAGYSTPPEDV